MDYQINNFVINSKNIMINDIDYQDIISVPIPCSRLYDYNAAKFLIKKTILFYVQHNLNIL